MSEVEEGAVKVHITNAGDLQGPTKVEEVYAEHFTASSFTLPVGEIIGTGVGAVEPTQILQLDPLRQRCTVSFNGSGQVILCHSLQQATSLAQNVQQAADEGFLYTIPGSITPEATGPLWAVLVAGSGTGSGTPDAATGAVGTNTGGNASLPAGSNITGFTVTFTAATTAAGTVTVSNVAGGPLTYNIPVGTTVFTINYPGAGLPASGGAPTVAVSATVGVGPGNIVDTGTLVTTSGVVGVLQERRNS